MKKATARSVNVKSLSLRDIAVVVFRQRWLILLTFLTTVTVAALLAVFLPYEYESRMKFLVKNVRVEAPVTPDKTGVAVDPNDVSEGQIISQIELLKSRDLLLQVVTNNKLAESATGAEPTTEEIERAVYQLELDLQITPVKKANIIEVSYNSKSPETAAAVLNNLSELYLEKHIKLHRTPGTFDFFKEQTEQSQRELRDAENKLSAFQKKMNVVSITQQKDLGLGRFMETQARLNDLNGAIKETDKRIAEIEKQLSGMERRISTQSRVIPNQDSVERFNTMLVELRNRRAQLLTKFQPEDRLVKEVDEQIRITNEALAKATQTTYSEQASDINPLRQNLESELAKAKVEQTGRFALRDNLEGQVRQYQEQLAKLKGATTVHDDLSRQVKKADETYLLYAQKQEESRISNELDKQKFSNVTVAEAATVPRLPNKANRPLTVLLGGVMGLLLGIGCAITAEFFRETVHTPRELEALTGLLVVATVPLHSRQLRMRELNFDKQTTENDFVESKADDHIFIEFLDSKKHAAYPKS
jgi:uncharacterized protein involved in exopolysaccharide biosynthesis